MIDLVMGAAIGYTDVEVRPFLRSLRESGYDGRVIFFANKGGAEEAKKWDVDVRACKPFHGKPHAARFLWLQEALEEVRGMYEGVLLADTRDVIFQDDLQQLPSEDFHAFEEDLSMTLGSCPYNSLWLKLGYGEQALADLSHEAISCVGVSCGAAKVVWEYLVALRTEIERIQPRTSKPQDQAAHNHLMYGTFPAHLWRNEGGQVYTVGYMSKRSVKIVDGFIRNKAGEIPSVVHQWDRHKNLKRFVEERYL